MSDKLLEFAAGVHLRPCGEQWAAFHTGTGDTHLLDPVAGVILQCLQENGPLALAQLSDCLEWDVADAGILAEWLAVLQHNRMVRERTECL